MQLLCLTPNLYGQPLAMEKVIIYKYLGLMLSSDLSQHINNIYALKLYTIGNSLASLSIIVFTNSLPMRVYISDVHLNSSSQPRICSPCIQIGEVNSIERVQKFAPDAWHMHVR